MSRELIEKMARAMLDAREMAKVSDARWDALWPNSIKGQELEVMAQAAFALLSDPANITDEMVERAAETLLLIPRDLSPGTVDELRRAIAAAFSERSP